MKKVFAIVGLSMAMLFVMNAVSNAQEWRPLRDVGMVEDELDRVSDTLDCRQMDMLTHHMDFFNTVLKHIQALGTSNKEAYKSEEVEEQMVLILDKMADNYDKMMETNPEVAQIVGTWMVTKEVYMGYKNLGRVDEVFISYGKRIYEKDAHQAEKFFKAADKIRKTYDQFLGR